MDAASSSTSGAQTVKWSYDVFLSFRGEDTRNNFVDHLYAALDQAGIYTFKDDERLERGKSISPELIKAIQESRVAVVVFSKNYANSSWCLEELAKIIECRDVMGQIVLPVFYDVDPSDVRKQKGTFQDAFQQHEMNLKDDLKKVLRWREALVTTANLSGWDVPSTASGREAECIKLLVKKILLLTPSYTPENLIGMDSRVQHVKSLLIKEYDGDVCIIGIWGMGGIGKTTIARAVFNQISNEFDGCSFVEDVRENSTDKRGLQSLQEKLLSDTLQQLFQVKDCDDGICQIQSRLGRKKVLIVLDDVDNTNQLEFLANAREWFGPGSRIMITTRDKHVIFDAQAKYTPELLTQTQAMELFSIHAFKKNIPPKAFKEVSDAVVTRTGHLPLALKVLGSHLRGKKLEFWQSALKVLSIIPHEDINRKLKISYDGLNSFEKKIFLYIACSGKGVYKVPVEEMFDGCGFEPASGIPILIEKSLLTISNTKFVMHDLIQDMGRWIVREYHPNTLVWDKENIKEMLTTSDINIRFGDCFLRWFSCFRDFDVIIKIRFGDSFLLWFSCFRDFDVIIKKLETVEAIMENQDYGDKYNPEVFKSMKKLIVLMVYGKFTSTEPTYFPQELRWICWKGYPFQSMRLTSGLTKLLVLALENSLINQLQIENKAILINLKSINLHGSQALTSFPDISGIPNLKWLSLTDCYSLVEVHKSVLLHKSIEIMNLINCKTLKFLPPSIQMESLRILNLDGCESLERFPEVTMEMGRLLRLQMYGCNKINALPSSIRLFTGLIIFSFGNFVSMPKKNKQCMQCLTHFTHLRILLLWYNDLVDDDFPSSMHNAWPSLEELVLTQNLFTRLTCISQFSHLKYLDIRYCSNLEELPELPSLIQSLEADHCTSLKRIGDLSNKYRWLFKISLHFCPKLLEDQETETHIANLLMKSLKCAAVNHRLSIIVPGSKIPNWFTNQQSGNKIALNLPQKQMKKIEGLAVCCLLSQSFYNTPIQLLIRSKASGVKRLFDMPTTLATAKSSECVWIGYISLGFLQNLCYGFQSENYIISFEPDTTICEITCAGDIVECGVCVVYKDAIKGMTESRSEITYYEEVKVITGLETAEEFQHARYMKPTFSVDDGETGDRNTVKVLL